MGASLLLDLGRVLYVGPLGALPAHQASASAMLVGMERPFTLSVKGVTQSHRVAYVPSRTLHSMDFDGGRGAALFFDPGTTLINTFHDEAKLILAIDQVIKPFRADSWNELLRTLNFGVRPAQVEPRMEVIARRLMEVSDEGLSATTLAASARLSVSRLEHLFKAQFGVPLGSFRSWYRFRLAVKHLLGGSSITDAAHGAGFHDSAHFAHAFRDTFGLPPSEIFTPSLQGYCME